MRYTSAMVLSTFAVGQAAAASHMHNRHASFHERRQADAKRSPGSDVDWNKVAVDLNEVDWDTVNWHSVFSSPSAAAAAATPIANAYTPAAAYAAASTPTPVKVKAEAVYASSAKPSSTPAAYSKVASSEAPAATSKAASDVSTNSVGDLIGDLGDIVDDVTGGISDTVSDLLHGVSTMVKNLGIISEGKNDKSSNGGIWIGSDSKWKAEFTNDATSDAVIFCWKADGFSGMSLNVNQPEISVGLKSGQSVEVSFAENVPAACAPAWGSTKLALFGGLDQTWWEVTFGSMGAFDVSRNVNMKGCNISSKGSKCVSDMNTCVFKCKNEDASSCEAGTDYDLFNCQASNGGGGGYDTVMAGTGGGCSMGSSGETVKVSFS